MNKVLKIAASQIAASVDRAFSLMTLSRSQSSRRRSRAESLGHKDRMEALNQIGKLYDNQEFFRSPAMFFPSPQIPASIRSRFVRNYGHSGSVSDLTWLSGYEPFCDQVAPKYMVHKGSRLAAARIFRHLDRPRPVAILVHGYLGGLYAFEERMFPVRWLFKSGMDIALAILPFHGVRSEPGRIRPRFPSSDPRITVEGFRQAIWDLRSLATLLMDRGAPAFGIMGMSLGGYTTALMATVEPRLSFAMPVIPLASIAEFARDDSRLAGTEEEQELQCRAIEDVYRVVSPLARPSLVPPERTLVIAGEADRITPAGKHARVLARHLGTSLITFHGGHLIQFGRRAAFREAGRLLRKAGMFEA